MKYRGFVAALVLVCGVSAGQLFAQAAAESVLTHGLSSTAGSSLGKTLGNAMGNAASQLGSKLGQQTAPSVQRIPAVKAKTTSIPASAMTPAPSSGSLIASIQGGATPATSASSNCTAPKPAETNGAPSKSTSATASAPSTAVVATSPAPSSVTNCQTTPDADRHPAVVNLPAAN